MVAYSDCQLRGLISRSAAGVCFELSQLFLSDFEVTPERLDFALQPLNIRGAALIGGKWFAASLQCGELIGKLCTKQHLALGPRDFHAVLNVGRLCLACGVVAHGACGLRNGSACQRQRDGQNAIADVHTGARRKGL